MQMQARSAKRMGELVRQEKLQLPRARFPDLVPRRGVRIHMPGMAHDEMTGARPDQIPREIAPVIAPQIEGRKTRETLIGVKTQTMRRTCEASPKRGQNQRLGELNAAGQNARQAIRTVPQPKAPGKTAPRQLLQQPVAHPRQNLHMLMAIDEIRWAAHRVLESVELAGDFGPHLVPR